MWIKCNEAVFIMHVCICITCIICIMVVWSNPSRLTVSEIQPWRVQSTLNPCLSTIQASNSAGCLDKWSELLPHCEQLYLHNWLWVYIVSIDVVSTDSQNSKYFFIFYYYFPVLERSSWHFGSDIHVLRFLVYNFGHLLLFFFHVAPSPGQFFYPSKILQYDLTKCTAFK